MPPAHRPPKISRPLITKIGDAVAAGLYKEMSAALVDVHRDTLTEWLKRGAREKERLIVARQKDPRALVRSSERLFVELSDTVEKAIAVANARDLGVIDRRAQGFIPERVTVTRTKSRPAVTDDGKPVMVDGQVVMVSETTVEVRESATLPEWTAAAWKLERRDPKNWGRRTFKEISGKDGRELIPMSVIRAVMAAQDDIEDADFEIEDGTPAGVGPAPGATSVRPPALLPGTSVDLNDVPPDLPEQ